jgi:hypothetical protein
MKLLEGVELTRDEFRLRAGLVSRFPRLYEDATPSVEALIGKYMRLLDVQGERPHVQIRSNLGSKWLGRCVWKASEPNTSTIEIQKAVLANPKTLERVVAHEMIHHAEFTRLTPDQMALVKFGIRPDEHGQTFKSLAAYVNAAMGADFVTVTSDQEYEKAENTKEFFLLVSPISPSRMGWAWAARLSADGKARVSSETAKGARLLKTTDERWTRGVKIKKWGGYSVPKVGTEDEELLRRLFDAG